VAFHHFFAFLVCSSSPSSSSPFFNNERRRLNASRVDYAVGLALPLLRSSRDKPSLPARTPALFILWFWPPNSFNNRGSLTHNGGSSGSLSQNIAGLSRC